MRSGYDIKYNLELTELDLFFVQRMWRQICLYEFPKSPFVFHENAVYCGIAGKQKNFKNVSNLSRSITHTFDAV